MVSRDTTQHRLGSFRIFNARHPYPVAASLKPLNYARPATDFQTVPESRDFGVFSNKFECSVRSRRSPHFLLNLAVGGFGRPPEVADQCAWSFSKMRSHTPMGGRARPPTPKVAAARDCQHK